MAKERKGDVIQIANEFSVVHVQKVYTRNGERLQVTSLNTGSSILLDAMQLEIISLQKPERFTQLYEEHFGSKKKTSKEDEQKKMEGEDGTTEGTAI